MYAMKSFFILALTAGFASSALAQSNLDGLDPYYDQEGNPKSAKEIIPAAITPAAVVAPMKACSVYIYANWRDTIPVPQSWTSTACNSYKNRIGALHYNLACIFGNSFSMGTDDGGKPSPNCGW